MFWVKWDLITYDEQYDMLKPVWTVYGPKRLMYKWVDNLTIPHVRLKAIKSYNVWSQTETGCGAPIKQIKYLLYYWRLVFGYDGIWN